MRNFLKQLFCSHNYIRTKYEKLNDNFPYFDRRETYTCSLCNKEKIQERNGSEGIGDHV